MSSDERQTNRAKRDRSPTDGSDDLTKFRKLGRKIAARIPTFEQIGDVLDLGLRLDRLRFAERFVANRLDEIGADKIRWSGSDKLSRYRQLMKQSTMLARIKYGVDGFEEGVDLFAVADRASKRLILNSTTLDRLYAASTANLPRDEWQERLAAAYALEQMVRDYRDAGLSQKMVLSLFRPGSWDEIVRRIEATDRIVCLTFHSGFLSPARFLYARQREWSTIRGADSRRADATKSTDSARNMLFTAYREVQNGTPLLIAPDGPWGNLTEQLDVLGTTTFAGEGAAFLAYQADATTAWFNVVREGQYLVPMLVEGFRREKGEKYEAYKVRWREFYTARITDILTGNPDSLALRGRWSSALASGSSEALS